MLQNIIKYSDKIKLIAIAWIFTLSIVLPLTNAQQANALSGSEFNPGRIIDDSVFYDGDSMSVSQIQNFLNSKVPNCDTNGTKSYGGTTRADYGRSRGYPPPYTCLKDYKQDVQNIANGGSDLCKGSITGGNNFSAARIIYDVGRACGINPKVLIVLLEKEQSLVTDDWPWSIQYRSATGYGCPDTAPCDSDYYGFFNQVYQAAKAFRRYEANPGWYNYRHGRNNTILWHPNSSCGTSTVSIENQATASLYIYTPYRPNQAALNNLYGTGNGCSSYGNRNFWRIFNDWFGSTNASPTTIYRLFNENANNHLYTKSENERDKAVREANFTYEGEAFDSCSSGGTSVYRLYNSVTGRHLFTTSESERDKAHSKTNFTREGTAFKVCGNKKVYRLYSSSEQKHFYTTSTSERDKLVNKTSFVYEGVAFKVN